MNYLKGFRLTYKLNTINFTKVAAAFFVLVGSGHSFGQKSMTQFRVEGELTKAGRASFVANCSGCHGLDAKGQGPAAAQLLPRPRNLVDGSFKFRTTPSGSYPLISDLVRTLNEGVLGTSIPSFRVLPEKEKLALALYIKSLRSDWNELSSEALPVPPAPRDVLTVPGPFLQSAIRGKKLYMEACHTCHGDGGLGFGPSSEGLVDGEGQLIRPANLSKAFIKGGKGSRDIFRAITTGLDGTPMPGFAETYDVASRWDIVSYVLFLRTRALGKYKTAAEPETLLATFRDGK